MTTQADIRRRIRVWELTRAQPRDGDGDGFVYDGTPAQRPAPPRVRKVPSPSIASYRQRLRDMDDETLDASLRLFDDGTLRFDNPDDARAARRAVVAEKARRARNARVAAERQARYEALLAEGHDEADAWALATGRDPAKYRAKLERNSRPSVAQMRRDWQLVVESELAEAERATNGQMVRPEGRLRYDRARRANVSVNPRDFWRRNAAYVGRWASDEFRQWAANRGGFTTFAAYRAMVEGRNVRDVRAQQNRRLGEFG